MAQNKIGRPGKKEQTRPMIYERARGRGARQVSMSVETAENLDRYVMWGGGGSWRRRRRGAGTHRGLETIAPFCGLSIAPSAAVSPRSGQQDPALWRRCHRARRDR